MKILVVSGFLGAGKTTFIQTMARRVQKSFVIYENEYAGAGIDTQRLEGSGLDVWESTENCVCCSGKADLASAILTISGSLDPDYLVIEPTGVAKLGSIVENIRQVLYDRITLLPPLAVIDGQNFLRQHLEYPGVACDQVRAASTVVVSKVGAALSSELDAMRAIVASLNPHAEFVGTPYDGLDTEWFESLLCGDSPEAQGADAVQGRSTALRVNAAWAANAAHNVGVAWETDLAHSASNVQADDASAAAETMPSQLAFTDVRLPSPTHLIALLDRLAFGEFGAAIRAKGSLRCGNEWLSFDFVCGSWSLSGDLPQKKGACVFIGKDLRQMALRRLFERQSPVRGARMRPAKQKPRTPALSSRHRA